MKPRVLRPVLALVCLSMLSSATALAAGPAASDLAVSNLNTPAGKMTGLHSGPTYQAGAFPFELRLAPPDGTWARAQWTTSSHGNPAFGRAAAGHGATSASVLPRTLPTL